MNVKDKMRVGIIGTGWIAEKAAITLNGTDNCEALAVGSRSQENMWVLLTLIISM